jgi:hypothetical protein
MVIDMNLKKILIALFGVLTFCNCETEQLVINTGTASPYYDGNMMEYLRSDKYNWELTVELIERAGLSALFEGVDPEYPEITFFGFKSHSVIRFLLDSQHKDQSNGIFTSVQDIPVELARELVLKHVVKGKHLKNSIALRNPKYVIGDDKQDGGTVFATVEGNLLRAYLERTSYGGVPDAGPIILYLYSITVGRMIPMATPDIQPDNGVVHALNYGYELGVI